MNYSFNDWKLRMAIYKLYIKRMYNILSVFANKYFPFNYLFRFLHLLKVEKMYGKNLEAEKQNTKWLKDRPWLIDDIANNVKERTWNEYELKLKTKENEVIKGSDEAERICNQINLKLDHFTQFLLKNVEKKQAIIYSAQISKLADPNDIGGTYERLSDFIDSIIKKHST